jgi:hypothetical protein
MNRPLMTHREWTSETKRLLNTRALRRSELIAAYKQVASRVARVIPACINDWHLVQTWHLLSLEQARAGNHRSAAVTLCRLVAHHEALLLEHRRAFVSGASAAAVQLSKSGDVSGARRMLRSASRVGRGLQPQDGLVRQARAIVTADAKRSSALANRRPKRAALNS